MQQSSCTILHSAEHVQLCCSTASIGTHASSVAPGASLVDEVLLCLQNLPPDADKLFLYEKFSPYGAILSVKVCTSSNAGADAGQGCLEFWDRVAVSG